MADLGTDGTYNGKKGATWYAPRDLGVSYCPFCGCKELEEWESMHIHNTIYYCTSCGNYFVIGKTTYATKKVNE